MNSDSDSLPILDLSEAKDPVLKERFLSRLHDALFNIGFLYIKNHGVRPDTISNLVSLLPALFAQLPEAKAALSKMNSPHFLGYSGYAEEITLGEKDLREQFDFATEVPVIWDSALPEKGTPTSEKDFSKLYWRLRGPNQWPSDSHVPGFRKAFTDYHDALQMLSYQFVHLVEESFGISVGTFDTFFRPASVHDVVHEFVPPQHRIKLVKYPPSPSSDGGVRGQGVGSHKDSSGWLTFLYQVGEEEGLEVLDSHGKWIVAPPIRGTFVVNFGNAFEAATQGAVKATIHRVKAPGPSASPRYSIPFFQGLPLDLTVSEIQSYMPESVRGLRRASADNDREDSVSSFQDPRWDSLGESQLRKWIRSHPDVATKWYGKQVTDFYLQ
ncbi:hypothetical protein BCR34DRAFT_478299 [Clohesyomyces aquaticus]|uniref:Fe2OG dioxygenase domain-containing protein n=1 Tax=Clohesyomyces aquaticus TaxID=1231657 RepID=A0A1Y1ZZE5_9PLEO|nr:hypothetical protein BCR34DRAFT_478299 [Clohesyomyces aquaticus]